MPPLAVLVLAAQLAAPPADSTELRGEALMHALRAGGHTIVLRHARTDRSVQEPLGAMPATRAEQRNLSAEGVRDAALMGAVLRKYGVPIGEIVASPMYRTRETAQHAAGEPTLDMALRTFPSTDAQAALVAAAPRPGTNRLLVTHHFVIVTHVPGIRPGDIGESEAVVVRPSADGRVAVVGRILLADWERLAGVAPAAPAGAPHAAPRHPTPHARPAPPPTRPPAHPGFATSGTGPAGRP